MYPTLSPKEENLISSPLKIEEVKNPSSLLQMMHAESAKNDIDQVVCRVMGDILKKVDLKLHEEVKAPQNKECYAYQIFQFIYNRIESIQDIWLFHEKIKKKN